MRHVARLKSLTLENVFFLKAASAIKGVAIVVQVPQGGCAESELLAQLVVEGLVDLAFVSGFVVEEAADVLVEVFRCLAVGGVIH